MLKKSLVGLTLVAGWMSGWGQLPSEAEVFDLTVEKLIADSPALNAYAADRDAAILESKTLGNLPDPEVEGEYLRGTDGSNRWNAGLSWNLDWPGVYSARNKEGKLIADAEKIRFESQRRQVRLEVAQALSDYIKANQRLAVLNKLSDATDSISSIVDTGIKLGHLTNLDANKISIERARLQLRIVEEEQSLSEALQQIAALCGGEATSSLSSSNLSFSGQHPQPKEYYLSKIDTYPEIRLAQTQILQSEAAAKVISAEALPSLSIGYAHAFEEETHFNGGTLGISLPIFSSSGKKKAAQAKKRAAELSAEAQQEALSAQISSISDRLIAIQEAISKTEPVFKNDSPQLLLLKAYINGRISLLEYIQERSFYTEAELDLIDLQASKTMLLQTLMAL